MAPNRVAMDCLSQYFSLNKLNPLGTYVED